MLKSSYKLLFSGARLGHGLQGRAMTTSQQQPAPPRVVKVGGLYLSRKDILAVTLGLAAAVWAYDFMFLEHRLQHAVSKEASATQQRPPSKSDERQSGAERTNNDLALHGRHG